MGVVRFGLGCTAGVVQGRQWLHRFEGGAVWIVTFDTTQLGAFAFGFVPETVLAAMDACQPIPMFWAVTFCTELGGIFYLLGLAEGSVQFGFGLFELAPCR